MPIKKIKTKIIIIKLIQRVVQQSSNEQQKWNRTYENRKTKDKEIAYMTTIFDPWQHLNSEKLTTFPLFWFPSIVNQKIVILIIHQNQPWYCSHFAVVSYCWILVLSVHLICSHYLLHRALCAVKKARNKIT